MENRYKLITEFLVIIDFVQLWSISIDKYRKHNVWRDILDHRERTCLFVNYRYVCKYSTVEIKVDLNTHIVSLNLSLTHASRDDHGTMLCIFLRRNIQLRRFDRYTMRRRMCLQISNQLKILWLSTFIHKLNLSIDNYRQISSTIDLSTTFLMIDFDQHVTSWFIWYFSGS